MLLRHVSRRRNKGFFINIHAMSKSSRTNSTSKATGTLIGQSEKQNRTLSESKKDIPSMDKGKRRAEPTWNFGNAVLLPSEDLKDITRRPEVQKTNNITSRKMEWGPKSELQMYRNPFYPPRLFPWIYHPTYSPFPPNPNTFDDLLCNIIAMRNATPVIPLSTIIAYHDRFPWVQSAQSYEALLELAVRNSSVGGVRKLVRGLLARGIEPSERIVVLVTRLKVRVAHRTLMRLRKGTLPPESKSLQRRSRGESPGNIIGRLIQELHDARLQERKESSLNILGEYLGTPRLERRSRYRSDYLYAFRREVRATFEGRTQTTLPLLQLAEKPVLQLSSQYKQLGNDYSLVELMSKGDFVPSTPPLSAILATRLRGSIPLNYVPTDFPHLQVLWIRRLLLLGRRTLAIKYAFAYVQRACTDKYILQPQLLRHILSIIHLLVHRKYGCPSYSVGRGTLLSFLRIHPDLAPVPHTLYILLQSLQTVRRRAQRALEALNWFRQRWPEIEDEPVRRTIAKYGLQDKSANGRSIAFEMASREARFGTRWRGPAQIGLLDVTGQRTKARPFAETYARSWRDKEKWVRMGLVKRGNGFVLRRPAAASGEN